MKTTWTLPILFLALAGCPDSKTDAKAGPSAETEKAAAQKAQGSAAERGSSGDVAGRAEAEAAGEADAFDEEQAEATAAGEGEAPKEIPLVALDFEGYDSGRLTYTGEADGQPTEFVRELSKAGLYHSYSKHQERGVNEYYRTPDTLYLIEGERCTMMRGEQMKSMAKVLDAAHGMSTGNLAYPLLAEGVPETQLTEQGTDEVAGERARRYALDGNWDIPLNLVRAKGTVWLHTETRRPLRSEGSLQIKPAIGDAEARTFKWRFDTEKLGEDIEVTLPDSCRQEGEKANAVAALPQLDGAKEIMAAGPMTMYEAPGTVQGAYDFYMQKLAAAGWEPAEHGVQGEEAGIRATQGEETLAVGIEKQGKGVRVTLIRSE